MCLIDLKPRGSRNLDSAVTSAAREAGTSGSNATHCVRLFAELANRRA